MKSQYTEKQLANKRLEALKQEHSKWVPAYQDLSTYIDQTRGIFNGNRSKIGKMIDHKVLLDSHATDAKRITASGMQTGMTDPSRPWFKLTMDDFILDNVPGVRVWLDEVTRRMLAVLNKSNIYKVFQNCYDELVQFGTGCFLILEDYEEVVRGRSFTAGEYYLGVDNKGKINAFGRDFEMTTEQMLTEFGYESLSQRVKAYIDNKEFDVFVKIRHLIDKNDKRVAGYEDYLNMAWRSCYWEAGEGTNNFLAKRGYKTFSVIAPRWDCTTTEYAYGYGPSWHALGDIKELQVTHKDMLTAQEKLHRPPVVEDASVIGHSNQLPGGVTKVSSNVPNAGVRAAYQIDPKLDSFQLAITNLHQKIDKRMFADVFRMISNIPSGGNPPTAYQITQMKQEQMMLLGPILHGLNEEMHSKAIDIIYQIMDDNGLLPEPPEGIEGQEIKVQYISILAQAQRAMGIEQINQTIGIVGNMAGLGRTDAWDNIDVDEVVREVNDLGGAPAKIILSKEQVAQLREARAQQQNQMLAMQAANSAADTGKKLADSPVGTGSMLDVVGQAAAQR